MDSGVSFTVVLACRNAAARLARAVDSVLCQTWPRTQLVVQDGASSDGSVELLRRYGSRIDLATCPDDGVYDAWNRAARRIHGDWTLFLGADDFLVRPDVLERCAAAMAALDAGVVFAYGVLAMGRAGNVQYFVNRSRHEVFDTFRKGDMGLPFPATFVRTRLLRGEPFDASYMIAGDFEFCSRHAALGNVARMPLCVSYFEMDGLSSNPSFSAVLREERRRIYRHNITARRQEFRQAALDTATEGASGHDFS